MLDGVQPSRRFMLFNNHHVSHLGNLQETCVLHHIHAAWEA